MHAPPWPLTAERDDAGALVIGGVSAPRLASDYGTPLWVVDEKDLKARCRAYVEAFAPATVAYGAKAWPTTGILQLVDEEGLWVDVASGGELHTALVAGVDPAHLILHGNNKSDDELAHGLDAGVGRVVVDNLDELERLEALAAERGGEPVAVWLRLTPGIETHTHAYVQTGTEDSKFGLSVSLGHADEAITAARGHPHLRLAGVHTHIGSQLFDTGAYAATIEVMLDLLDRWADQDVLLGELNLGGGMAIGYTHEQAPPRPEDYARAVRAAVTDGCAERGLEPPRLFVEPGRAIVGPSTLTLYTVGVVKQLEGIRTYVSVDGGMSDNIRPALYDARHELTVAGRAPDGPGRAVTVVGKHCESGDLVAEQASLPADLAPGDLLAVAATGAYTEAMASNYNRLPRPGAVLVRDGEVRPLIRPETYEDLLERDVPVR